MFEEPEIALPIVLTTLMFLLLLTGVILAFVVATRQKQKQQLLLTETRLDYQKELRLVDHELRENLMNRFSREIHDNLGHEITCLRLALENYKLDHPDVQKEVSLIDESISRASEQMRLLSRSFSSDFMFKLSLEEAIDFEIERQMKLNVFQIKWQNHYVNRVLDDNQKLMVFRMFQEMLTNTIRHSGADSLEVGLSSADGFQLRFKENGCGFDLEKILAGNEASGLKNMLKRAHISGLECEVKTSPGQGCEYLIYQAKTIT